MHITCKITIYNKSNTKRNYYLIQDSPQPENGPSGRVFANVYGCSPELESGSEPRVTWECSSDFYAIFGTPANTDSGTKVTTNSFKAVQLGPGGSHRRLLVSEEGSPLFDDQKMPKANARGGFQFSTDNFAFSSTRQIYIGIGGVAPDGSGGIVPMQTYVAEPQLSSTLYPKMTCFIATGKYASGTLIDRESIGGALKIDFTGAAFPEVTLYHSENGSYIESSTKSEIREEGMGTPGRVSLSVVDVR